MTFDFWVPPKSEGGGLATRHFDFWGLFLGFFAPEKASWPFFGTSEHLSESRLSKIGHFFDFWADLPHKSAQANTLRFRRYVENQKLACIAEKSSFHAAVPKRVEGRTVTDER